MNDIGDLPVGSLVRMDGEVWRIGLKNQSRARLDPVTARTKAIVSASGGLLANVPYFTGSVNVSPHALLETVDESILTDAEARRKARLEERVTEERVMSENQAANQANVANVANVATQPKSGPVVPTVNPNRAKNRAMKAQVQAQKAQKAAERKAQKAAQPQTKAPKALKPCACGCGEEVAGFFAMGHDARFKGWLLKVERGAMAVKDLPPAVQKAYQWVKKGDGYIPTKNYKGEPHRGYDLDLAPGQRAKAPKAPKAKAQSDVRDVQPTVG